MGGTKLRPSPYPEKWGDISPVPPGICAHELDSRSFARSLTLHSLHRESSELREVTASIMQGSAIGPAMFVVEAADLKAITPGNLLCKYANDTYIIIPASNSHTTDFSSVNAFKRSICNTNLSEHLQYDVQFILLL